MNARSTAVTPTDPAGTDLDLTGAARRLGVHYMTAYRYVRTGRLPAVQRDGRWWVSVADLDRLSGGPRVAPAGRRADPVVYATRLAARLVAGDEQGAWAILQAGISSGRTPTSAVLDVLSPALRTIGTGWERGELSIGDEHLASAVATRLIGRLGPHFGRSGRTRGSVLLACVPDERHALPVALLSAVLRGNGYDVIELGADTPAGEIAAAAASARASRLRAVGLSLSTTARRGDALHAVAAVREASPDTLLLVGGGAVPSRRCALGLGADEWAPDAGGVITVLDGGPR